MRCAMNFASAGRLPVPPRVSALLQGNTSVLVPCQLCRPWRGISHRQKEESSARRVHPSPAALGGLCPGCNHKRWIVLCRDEGLKAPS